MLSTGTRLGPYEILSSLGAGGMGEVYRARDTRLDRDVALKVLPDVFASDPERLARFEREAKTLAALNHPHIAQIYGLEKSEGIHALAMELVEGEDLSERIARGAVPVDEAVPIARQINGRRMIAVSVDLKGPEPSFGTPVELFSEVFDYGQGVTIPNYDVTPDGHFIMLRPEPNSSRLRVVLKWTDELKRLLAAPRN